MEDVADLLIRVRSEAVDRATSALDRLTGRARQAEGATGSFMSRVSGGAKVLAVATAGILATTGAIRGMNAVIGATRQYQVMQAGLKTATGSLEAATAAYKQLERIAATTPFSVQSATDAFTRLVNYGLTPSERALRSYGDAAAATNKDIVSLVEAVADAVNGEFERAKEAFNVKSKNMGDTIEFTFRGMRETVANNSEAIEEYFIRLGENNFAGAMADRMDTLDGAFSNLGDSWDRFLINIGTGTGMAATYESALRSMTSAVDELNAIMASGQFESNLMAWQVAFEGFYQSWEFGFSGMRETATSEYEGIFNDSKGFVDDIIAYFQSIPVMFVAIVEEAAIRLWGLVTAIKDVGAAMYEQFSADMEALAVLARFSADAIKAAFQGNLAGAEQTAKLGMKIALEENVKATADIENRANNNKIAREQAVQGEIQSIYGRASDRLLEQQRLRQEALAKRAAFDNPTETPADALSLNKKGGGGATPPPRSRGGGGGGGGGVSPTQALMRELQMEEQAVGDSYARRLMMIESATEAGSALRAQASLRALDMYEEEQMQQIEQDKRNLDTMMEAFAREEQLIRDSYERRKAIILATTDITETEKLRMLEQAQKQYANAMKQHTAQQNQIYLNAASDFFSDLSSLSGFENAKMFKIAQGAAIANATIKMYESATAAYATGSAISPFLGPVFAAAAIAAGAANIASIKSQTFSGAYEHGGMIPAGQFGLVGEAGPEMVRGPAVVTSARTTADMYGRGNGSTAPVSIQIINNAPGIKVEKQEGISDKDLRFIITAVDAGIARGVATGNGQTAKAMESTYGSLQRGRVG